jgi:hypothetical protein
MPRDENGNLFRGNRAGRRIQEVRANEQWREWRTGERRAPPPRPQPGRWVWVPPEADDAPEREEEEDQIDWAAVRDHYLPRSPIDPPSPSPEVEEPEIAAPAPVPEPELPPRTVFRSTSVFNPSTDHRDQEALERAEREFVGRANYDPRFLPPAAPSAQKRSKSNKIRRKESPVSQRPIPSSSYRDRDPAPKRLVDKDDESSYSDPDIVDIAIRLSAQSELHQVIQASISAGATSTSPEDFAAVQAPPAASVTDLVPLGTVISEADPSTPEEAKPKARRLEPVPKAASIAKSRARREEPPADYYRPRIIIDFHNVIDKTQRGQSWIPQSSVDSLRQLERHFEVHIVSFGSWERNKTTKAALDSVGISSDLGHNPNEPRIHFVSGDRSNKATWVRRLRAQAVIDDSEEVLSAVRKLNDEVGSLYCAAIGIHTKWQTHRGGFWDLTEATEFLLDRVEEVKADYQRWRESHYNRR